MKPDEEEKPEPFAGHLVPLRVRGNMVVWSLVTTAISGIGLFLLTGLAWSPWLFLLYPILIGALVFSLGALSLHLIRRL